MPFFGHVMPQYWFQHHLKPVTTSMAPFGMVGGENQQG